MSLRGENRARGKGTISASKAEDYSGTEVSTALSQLLLASRNAQRTPVYSLEPPRPLLPLRKPFLITPRFSSIPLISKPLPSL